MPNISFDIFYEKDILNFTATRGKQVPKIKPAWKTRTAPKLPPKEVEPPSFAAPLSKPRIETLPSSPTSTSPAPSQAKKPVPPKINTDAANKATTAGAAPTKTNAGIKAPKLNSKPKA